MATTFSDTDSYRGIQPPVMVLKLSLAGKVLEHTLRQDVVPGTVYTPPAGIHLAKAFGSSEKEIISHALQVARGQQEAYCERLHLPDSTHTYSLTISPDGDFLTAVIQEVRNNKSPMNIYRTIFDSTDRFILLLDKNGRLIECNSRARGIVHSLLDVARRTHPEAVQRALQGEACSFSMNILRRGIGLLALDCRISPLRDDAGDWQFILLEAADVSSHHSVIHQLQQRQQWYQAIAKHLPGSCFLVYDDKLNYVMAQGQAFDELAYGTEIFQGRTVPEALTIMDLSSPQESFEEVLHGATVTYEVQSRKTGYAYSVTNTPVYEFETADRIIGGLLLFMRVDYVKKKEAELHSKNAQLEQYHYIASHDLQEPLRMIVSYSQLIASRYKDKLGDEGQEWLEFLKEGATRMQQLIYDIRILNEIDNSELPASDININMVLATVCTRFMDDITKYDIEVTADPLPSLTANAQHFRMLLENLLSNAIKFRHPDRRLSIQIKVTRRDHLWIFSIVDNGIGFKHEYAGRIFNIFMRLNSREQYPGSGIGLAVCKRIVERNGGEIWAESEENHGTTIIFTWPASQ